MVVVASLTKKVGTVKKADKEIKSDFDDNDFESLFGSMLGDDYVFEDFNVDFDIERSVDATRAKAKGKAFVSPKKR